jgi:hypothetical protein
MFSTQWRCDVHGDVVPLQPVPAIGPATVADVANRSSVPVWLAWPLPTGWLVTGLGWAGDDRTGPRAVAVAYTGPAPRGGPADLVLLAEEPALGWGAGLAGLDGADPGPHLVDGSPALKVLVDGHPTPLWQVPTAPDRTAYVGEADGRWLWAIAWPDDAGLVLHGVAGLHDLRDGWRPDLPLGAPTSRLRPQPLGRGRPTRAD